MGPSRISSRASDGGDFKWFEVSLTPAGDLVSECQLTTVEAGPAPVGVRWDTGSELAVEIHTPWRDWLSAALRAGNPSSRLQCGHESAVKIDRIDVPTNAEIQAAAAPGSGGSPLSDRNPAFSVGMRLLGSSPLIFDLPHGRIWVGSKFFEGTTSPKKSGLTFKFEDGILMERPLRVSAIEANSDAVREALASGLKPGIEVSKIAGTNASDLNPWEIERRFSGEFGAR